MCACAPFPTGQIQICSCNIEFQVPLSLCPCHLLQHGPFFPVHNSYPIIILKLPCDNVNWHEWKGRCHGTLAWDSNYYWLFQSLCCKWSEDMLECIGSRRLTSKGQIPWCSFHEVVICICLGLHGYAIVLESPIHLKVMFTPALYICPINMLFCQDGWNYYFGLLSAPYLEWLNSCILLPKKSSHNSILLFFTM